nr:ribonuclease H-like domain-containing protein [Tanacetum cinerariifolium]
MESQSETTQTVSALKLPVLKNREYDLRSMRMEQYLTFTDHALWEVIVNGDSVSLVASASSKGPIPPKTAEQKLARKNDLKVKSTLMLAIPDEYLLKFHACKYVKPLWEAIKNMFGCNKESKKMQKTILKQNYETLLHQVKKDWIKPMIGKTDLGYDGQGNESEVLNNVFDNSESDGIDNQVNNSAVFKSKVSETITSVPKIETNASKTSKDGLEKPQTVRSSAPIIEDWELDSEDENVLVPKEVKKTVKPSLEKIEFVNARNTTVKNENKAKKPRKFSQSPREEILKEVKLLEKVKLGLEN